MTALLNADTVEKDISQHFFRYFSPEVAISEELRNEAFKIRHNVYCEELGFEEVRESGLEADEFDQRSLHLLIYCHSTGTFAGTVRLVQTFSREQLLPMEKFCNQAITSTSLHPDRFPRDSICEISRLSVTADFRRRKSDIYNGAATGGISEATYSASELRLFPEISVGLYLEIAIVAELKGINHFFVMMEPLLARTAAFVGIKFQQIGDVIDYHGKRAPYYINLDIFHKHLSPSYRKMFEGMKKGLTDRDF